MPQVLFSSAQLADISASLEVQTVGAAQDAVAATVTMAKAADSSIAQIWPFQQAWRTQARKDISDKLVNLQAMVQCLNSNDLTADASGSWPPIRAACYDLWVYCSLVVGEFPPDETGADALSEVLQTSLVNLQALPGDLGQAGRDASQFVGEMAGDLLTPVLDPLAGVFKWVALAAVAVVAGVAGYYYLKHEKVF